MIKTYFVVRDNVVVNRVLVEEFKLEELSVLFDGDLMLATPEMDDAGVDIGSKLVEGVLLPLGAE